MTIPADEAAVFIRVFRSVSNIWISSAEKWSWPDFVVRRGRTVHGFGDKKAPWMTSYFQRPGLYKSCENP